MAYNDKNRVPINISERLVEFIQKNRKAIIIWMAGIAVLVTALIAGMGVQNYIRTEAISRVERFNDQFEALRIDLNDPAKAGDVQALLDELIPFAEKTSAYAGARAYMILATVYADQKKWAEAEKAWTMAARKAPKASYLVPVSLYQAAVAAEDQGNITQAISLYTESLSYAEQFPAAPRAQFAIGRLLEGQNNHAEAVEAYRTLIDKWPAEAFWTNLANNRIITLTVSGSL
ncbi:MAG: tetratricopeptide repeat protein [Spirochaetaceae bacterium]|jgi:tetratricopeptide (TPR) repeat protein|nr:tetratricopeptide repeat protein [Spirochaetaceae bacterium]